MPVAGCTDIVSDDNCRISDGPVFDLGELVDNARMLNDRRAGRKPGFIWISGSYGPHEASRIPRPEEVRVHAWLHLVYGSRGLGYWASVPLNPDVWAAMRQFNHEAVQLHTTRLGCADARPPITASQNSGVHYSIWDCHGKVVLLAVNTSDTARPIRVDVPPLLGDRKITTATRVFDAGSAAVDAGVPSDEIPACQRRVYTFE